MSQLCTLAEVAEELRVTPQTVRNMIRKGEIDGVQVGVQWRVTQAALAAFLEKGGGRA